MARPLIRTLLRPRWAIGTVICLAIVVLFVNLGVWQLRRLDERRDHNALVKSRMAASAAVFPTVVSWGDDGVAGAEAVEHRRVRVSGRWLDDSTVLVRSRALDGQPGYHVLGTLVLDDTGFEGADRARTLAVVVNRGFAPLGEGDEDLVIDAVRPSPSNAAVELEGVLRRTETRGRIGPTDPAGGTLLVLNRVDVGRLQQQEPHVYLAPLFVQQVLPANEPGALPRVLPLPDASNEGPHLSYAGQWFLFAIVGLVGWPLLLRKVSREGDDDEVTDSTDAAAMALT